ncbi:MAG: hypothetical protein ACOYMA_06010 [Bacteroidia bacterium]
MKTKLFLFFLLAQLVAKAQFKLGTFSVGSEIGIRFNSFNIGNSSSNSNTVSLGVNGSVFLSKKSAVGFKIYNSTSSYNTKSFDSEYTNYNLNYQYYFPVNTKMGFYNQTDIGVSIWIPDNSKYSKFEIDQINLSNRLGFYTFLYQGLAVKVNYNLVGYSNYILKQSTLFNKSEYISNSFYLNLNPLQNIGDLQVAFVYYFNLKNNDK